MGSIRKPKRLTIRGDDEKEYMFLVKGGEDLRMDQRIEQVLSYSFTKILQLLQGIIITVYLLIPCVQLFGVMNEILMEDSACSQRGLRLKTYEVIPMTPRLAMTSFP